MLFWTSSKVFLCGFFVDGFDFPPASYMASLMERSLAASGSRKAPRMTVFDISIMHFFLSLCDFFPFLVNNLIGPAVSIVLYYIIDVCVAV